MASDGLPDAIPDPLREDSFADWVAGDVGSWFWVLRYLKLFEPPEELERAADTLERLLASHAIPPGAATYVEWLRGMAADARKFVAYVESEGLRWDWDREAGVLPKGGGPGAPRMSHTWLVGLAWEHLGGRQLGSWYGADTLSAIRGLLAGIMSSKELTDAKIKRRIQAHVERPVP